MNKVNNVYTIQLTTVKPVSIGDGGTISPLSDFYYDAEKEEVYLLNKPVFEKKLQESTNLLNEFIKTVNNQVTKSKNTLIFDFIQNKIVNDNSSSEDILKKYFHTLPIKAIGIDNTNETKTIVKNIDRPYIPGSSIKGAFRTALLYDKMIRDKKNNILDDNKYSNKKKEYKEFEQLLFGGLGEKHPIGHKSRFFKISDTTLTTISNMVVLGLKRIELKQIEKNASAIPINCEAIDEGTSLTFSVSIENERKNADFSMVNLLTKTDAFYRKCFDFEKETLSLPQVQNDCFKDQISGLKEFYNNFELSQGEYLMRIGSGKVRYDNSLFLAIHENDTEPSKLVFKGKRENNWGVPKDEAIYPLTRSVIASSGIPLGWVKLKVLNA